jgi:ABC-type amino acid transport substrate-binding protein
MNSLYLTGKLLCRLCLISIAFISPFGFTSENDLLSVEDNKLVIARGIGDYPPLEMVEGDRVTGLHIEIIRYVTSQLGMSVEFVSLPWVRAIKKFADGEVDAITYFGYTKEREKFSFYNEGNILSNTRWVFLALEERKHEFNLDSSLAGLEDLIIGVQHGYSYGKYFDGLKNITRDAVLNEADVELMLKKKRHDLSLMSYQEFSGFKNRGDFKGITALETGIDSDPQYIAFSRTNRDHIRLKKLSELFAKELERFKASDDYAELLIKYEFHRYR